MKIKILLLILLFAFQLKGQVIESSVWYNSASDSPTWTNLVSWWPLKTHTNDVHGTDNATATGAVSEDSAYYFDGVGDYLSFTGTENDVGTVLWEVWTTDCGNCDYLAGTSDALDIYTISDNRPRLSNVSGSSGVASISFSFGEWVLMSARFDDVGDTVRFGLNDSYETESWTTDVSGNSDNFGTDGPGSSFKGWIRNFRMYSDLKTDTYITNQYNSGNFTQYEDGE